MRRKRTHVGSKGSGNQGGNCADNDAWLWSSALDLGNEPHDNWLDRMPTPLAFFPAMSSSSALTFRVPSRDNFAQAQSAESKAAAKVTVRPYVAVTSTLAGAVEVKASAPHPRLKIGVNLDAKA